MAKYEFNLLSDVVSDIRFGINKEVLSFFKDDKKEYSIINEKDNKKHSFKDMEGLLQFLEEEVLKLFGEFNIKDNLLKPLALEFQERKNLNHFDNVFSALEIRLTIKESKNSCSVFKNLNLLIVDIDYNKLLNDFKLQMDNYDLSKELKDYLLDDYVESSIFYTPNSIISDSLFNLELNIEGFLKKNDYKYREDLSIEDIDNYLKDINKEVFLKDLKIDLNDEKIELSLLNHKEIIYFEKQNIEV